MDVQRALAAISPDEWARTPAAVRELIALLVADLSALRERLGQVEEQQRQHSQNSSRPPSSDPPSAPRRPPRPSSGRPPGGQPGHPGAYRALKPPDEVAHIEVVRPEHCARCGQRLSGDDPDPVRHQVTELPQPRAETVEYQVHRLACPGCGTVTTPALPVGVPRGAFGPRLQAIVSLLGGRYQLSDRQVQEVLAALFGADLSLGSVPALKQATSAALAAPVAEAQAYVQAQDRANVDETGWREAHHKAWLWVAVTTWVSVFLIHASRGSPAAKALLGADFAGIAGTDRWSGYRWLGTARRQLCWAHLKRDFTAFVERGGASATLGTALLTQVERLFALVQQVRDGTLAHADLALAIAPVQQAVAALLREGAAGEHPKTAKTCQNLLSLEAALWTFVTAPGLAPTNNAAERAIRPAVLWRKRSGGTQSAAGSRFVERLLTTVTTLRQQQRDVLAYLTAACEAANHGCPAPSLLPAAPATSSSPATN
jgi:transposase